ncbi:hypothetical protein MXU72_13675 [Klebsiella pneumoniae]|uniref:hypothetical protein n=1 Tax=Enterobacteriaceae TaxID=543 RepID=UPI001887059E|nr:MULTISPECIES: hypothetical protein [Enterobacteriaceae]MCM7633223.1 hypothetical protein [Enterobacter bugandensis]MDG0452618.1 hypothetical protein [Klebsiella pneumoniae]MDG0697573.1 hypothetical protein [Klebsiella pneumoniae]MDR8359927.1 hypothetical protein [Klebsiella pneumoniae]HDI2178926.1 hypothetical protein [Klebsiella pneumoniae]
MKNDMSVIVSMLCKKTPEVMSLIQESLDIFIALRGNSVEEIMNDKTLLDDLNRYVNETLYDEMVLEYGSVIIKIVSNK